MNLMHPGFSTAGKSVSLIVIKDSFSSVTSSGVTKGHLRKARALENGHQRESSELKDSQDGGFEGYGKKHNWTHKSCL
jgi:hypothetical protein